MKKFNWKILNFAFWLEVILSYLLPFKVMNGFRHQVGFPLSFLTVYDTEFSINPFMSMNLNLVALLFNVFIIYLIILACIKVHSIFKRRHIK